jgi:hypothetical protein
MTIKGNMKPTMRRSTLHQSYVKKLITHAIKLLGSEERARAMLAAGMLRLLVPKERREPGSARKPCGAFTQPRP